MGSGVLLVSKKWSDPMPINVTVPYSGEISLRVFIIEILVVH